MSVLTVTKENFNAEVVNSEKTVLLDFWAPWCSPCRMVAPVLEDVAKEETDIKVGKVNIDEQQELAMQFKVASIPTLVVVRDGQIVKQTVGALPKAAILELVRSQEPAE